MSSVVTSSKGPGASMSCGGIFDIPEKEKRLGQLDTEMGAPSFWEGNRRAQ